MERKHKLLKRGEVVSLWRGVDFRGDPVFIVSKNEGGRPVEPIGGGLQKKEDAKFYFQQIEDYYQAQKRKRGARRGAANCRHS